MSDAGAPPLPPGRVVELPGRGRTFVREVAGPAWLPVEAIGWWGLWIAAILTLVTGWDYLQAGLRHMLQDQPRPSGGNVGERA